jgi:hypothetical protein
MQTWVQRAFAPVRRIVPRPVSDFIRSAVTAAFTPFFHYYRLGHTRSSFANRAVDKHGQPIPWYTYPCIEFLRRQSFLDRRVLEFGAGQSTHWWAGVAKEVVSIEADPDWYARLKAGVPPNVEVYFVRDDTAAALQPIPLEGTFDVVAIDGLKREEMIDVAISRLTSDGAIIADDSDGYGFFDRLKRRGFRRVDFYGASPGVVSQRVTSIFFRDGCFLFANCHPIYIE